ncbi:hypothetical protein PTE30175_00300 [Pandoraea terrae]|uniref:Uncharacterized protein n=1 Tax=Pandoraea terrae TaxID=1537710 RepID=A0A5E4RP23_9BURK|nr:hypothetical protein PTE30175_00300 [Pandoraea terrae]
MGARIKEALLALVLLSPVLLLAYRSGVDFQQAAEEIPRHLLQLLRLLLD